MFASRSAFTAGITALAFGTALAVGAAFASGGGGGGGSSGGGGGSSGGGSSGGGGSGGSASSQKQDLTTCPKGQVWSTKRRQCMAAHSGVLPDPELTEYAFALAKAKRFDEALATLVVASESARHWG